jgi:hypothetical protein
MNARKLLLPLATALVAGAIAVGSGATFDSTTASTLAVTTGTLTQSNTKAGSAVISLTNMKPGDTVTGSLTLTNTGSLKQVFTLKETGAQDGFTYTNASGATVSYLNLAILDTTSGATVYNGALGGVATAGVALGTYAPAEAHTYRFTVTLDQATPNTYQSKSAAATYNWNGVQEAGTTYQQ